MNSGDARTSVFLADEDHECSIWERKVLPHADGNQLAL
jgi:hypothetical protein